MNETSTTTPITATFWQATLNNSTKMEGGSFQPDAVNVSAVPANQVKLFSIAGTTSTDTMYISNGVETWYRNGKVFSQTFPTAYSLRDGTTLTITRNSDAAGDLTYTQE